MPLAARLDLVRKAICGGARYGQIEWKSACLERFRKDPLMQSYTEVGVKSILRDHVCRDGKEPEVRKETDKDWLEKHPTDPWLYTVLAEVPEFVEGLYVKMKLLWEDGDSEQDAYVQLVSVHRGLVQ